MDPVTQGLLGATAATLAAPREKIRTAAWIGAMAGMAPDADVFIQSSTDPLLFLEYHRHFTHSFAFIPIGALICAALAWPLARAHLPFARVYLFAALGYATHALLDACTTYGTMLYWPFADTRVAWNWISVVDPAFTLPALALLIFSLARRRHMTIGIAATWMAAYLVLGVVQNDRATETGEQIAAARGHEAQRLAAKPAFGSLLLWKVVYMHEGRIHVDAVRTGLSIGIYPGESIERLDLSRHYPWLDSDSQQARDLERFRWFSNDHLAIVPGDPWRAADVRYSMLPDSIDPFWSIRLSPDASPTDHVTYITTRDTSSATRTRFFDMLQGRGAITLEELVSSGGR